jgi:predicted HD superfamily hydrolase involved in NAD metabolism
MNILHGMRYIHRLAVKIRLRIYLYRNLPAKRRAHSLAVAKLAKRLCVYYNEESYKGVIAGLGHDIARELDPEMIFKYAAEDGMQFSEEEKQHPLILHGRAGAFLLKHKFGIDDHDILEAVRNHVTGAMGMSLLAKILFVADFLEPGRGFLENGCRRRLLQQPLNVIMIRVLEHIFTFLNEHNHWIADISLQLYNKLKEGVTTGEKI